MSESIEALKLKLHQKDSLLAALRAENERMQTYANDLSAEKFWRSHGHNDSRKPATSSDHLFNLFKTKAAQLRDEASSIRKLVADEQASFRADFMKVAAALAVLQSAPSDQPPLAGSPELVEPAEQQRASLHEQSRQMLQRAASTGSNVGSSSQNTAKRKRAEPVIDGSAGNVSQSTDTVSAAKRSHVTTTAASETAAVASALTAGSQEAEYAGRDAMSTIALGAAAVSSATGSATGISFAEAFSKPAAAATAASLLPAVSEESAITTVVSPLRAKRPQSEAVESSPGKRSRTTPAVTPFIALSGFPKGDLQLEQLKEAACKLGISICNDAAFNQKVTHLITPANASNPKVLAAALTEKWIVTPQWLLDSAEQGSCANETGYGKRYLHRPFMNKSFFLSERFLAEQKSNRVANCRHFIQFGRGKITQSADSADYVMVSDGDSDGVESEKALVWKTFIAMITREFLS
eukprot:TRINITY_DN15012_c0_g1_i1.p1 TRINITY_DN15012_c0_g1~~TRINITY_DN15012_c0_g1_i1.p1  ORF type:complete len:466 (+),score=107.42 TRINITY_DN15012_c0_g1_i1:30-1427(+)